MQGLFKVSFVNMILLNPRLLNPYFTSCEVAALKGGSGRSNGSLKKGGGRRRGGECGQEVQEGEGLLLALQ